MLALTEAGVAPFTIVQERKFGAYEGECVRPFRHDAVDRGVEDAPACNDGGLTAEADRQRLFIDAYLVVVEGAAPNDIEPFVPGLHVARDVKQ